MKHQFAAAGAVLVCLIAVSGCGEPTRPQPATPGWLEVRLSTTAPDVGIVRLALAGGPVDSVSVNGTLSGFIGMPRGGAVPLIVVGPIGDGVVARIKVPDVSVSYSAVVVDAAAAGDYSLIPQDQFAAVVLRVSGHELEGQGTR